MAQIIENLEVENLTMEEAKVSLGNYDFVYCPHDQPNAIWRDRQYYRQLGRTFGNAGIQRERRIAYL